VTTFASTRRATAPDGLAVDRVRRRRRRDGCRVLLAPAVCILGAALAGGCSDDESGRQDPDEDRPESRAADSGSAGARSDASARQQRQAIEDLQRRVTALERRDAAGARGSRPAPGGGTDAARRPDRGAAGEPEETAKLRERLLSGAATAAEARKFWDRLRDPAEAVGSSENGASATEDGVARSPGTGEASLPDGPSQVHPRISIEDVRLPLDEVDLRWSGAKLITDGVRNNAAAFDAAGARIDAGPCPVSSTEPFTLRAFLRTRESGFCTVLVARETEEVGLMLTMGRVEGHVSFEAWSWRTVHLTSRNRVDDGYWHEIEVTYDPATRGAILSVDSVRQDAAVLGRGEARSAMLRLGDNLYIEQPFHGDLDEVSVLRSTARPEDFGAGAAAPDGRDR